MSQNKPLVSIVVPVYNAQDFLSECIDSILEQSYQNIEIILVNDGSTDSSGQTCDSYGKMDKRIKVIHQKNRGVSSARNVGINNANGEYITFIDADDMIHRDYVKYLQNDMATYHTSITTTAAKDTASRNQDLLSRPVQDDTIVTLGVEETMRELYRGTLEGTRNGVQMFSLKLLNENNIRYNESMEVGEDFDFFARAILASSKVVVDKRRMYFYRFNPASAMLQDFGRKHFDAIKNVENIGRSVESRIPGLKKAIDTMIFSDAIFYGAKMIRSRKQWPEEYQEIARYIKKSQLMVLMNNEAKNNTRIKAAFMIVFGVALGLKIMRGLIRW